MDQVHVQAPAGRSRTHTLEREFYADFPLLVNYVARLTDSMDDAPGIACEAMRLAFHDPRSHANQAFPRADIFRIATELSRRSLKPRRWFRRRRSTGVVLEGFPRQEASRALRKDTIQRALAAMPFEARAAVLLRDFVRLSYEELSEVLDIPVRKVVHALDRSRAELGEIYDYIKF